MRALFLSNNYPQDPSINVHGIFQRMGTFIESIIPLVDELDMLFFLPNNFEINKLKQDGMENSIRKRWGHKINLFLTKRGKNKNLDDNWSRYGAGIFSIYSQESFYPMVGEEQIWAIKMCLARKPDWIFAHRLHTMLPLMRVDVPLPPIFFDLDDIEHRAHARRVLLNPRWFGDRLSILQTPALRRAEFKAINLAKLTFICSDLDRDYLAKKSGSRNLHTIPNSVKIQDLDDKSTCPQNILFIGTFQVRPNIQSANYLVEKIWPTIKNTIPQAKLLIVGSHAENLNQFNSPPSGVIYLGFVPDIERIYKSVRLVCCPILTGAGTRIKIIEAASFGKAVVTTSMGAEGLDFEPGVSIEIHDDPDHISKACIRLLTDDIACRKMGRAAYNLASLKYDKTEIAGNTRKIINDNVSAMNMERALR